MVCQIAVSCASTAPSWSSNFAAASSVSPDMTIPSFSASSIIAARPSLPWSRSGMIFRARSSPNSAVASAAFSAGSVMLPNPSASAPNSATGSMLARSSTLRPSLANVSAIASLPSIACCD